jgi:hypothetical protein
VWQEGGGGRTFNSPERLDFYAFTLILVMIFSILYY